MTETIEATLENYYNMTGSTQLEAARPMPTYSTNYTPRK